MKRILLGAVAVFAFALCGFFANTASADHRHHGHHHGHHHHGHHHHGHHHHGHGHIYRPAYVQPYGYYPYGAGYYGGYQPYRSFYYQQPRFGLSIGF